MNLTVLENPANEVARSLTGRPYLSYSQVTTYQSCPLKWYFQYVAHRPHERVGSGLVFGSAIHSAVESHYRAMMAGEDRPDVDQLMNEFDASWNLEARAPIAFGKGESPESLRELAHNILVAFHESEWSNDKGTILGVEEEIRGTRSREIPDLLARLDLVMLQDDRLVIRDFKTSRSAWTSEKAEESAAQLRLYGDLASDLAESMGVQDVALEFVVVTKTRTPRIERHAVEPKKDQVDRLYRTMECIWRSMRAGHVYPVPSAMNCGMCPFQRACREWEG